MTGDSSFSSWLTARGDAVPEATPSFAPGEEFGGYVLTGFLGRGGSAEVYRATNKALGTSAAVKILHKDTEEAAVRFEREARLLMTDSHPSLPRFFAYGRRNGSPFIVMEELEQREAPSCDAEVARFLLRLCEGVAHLHSLGYVHRDIKPENILFRADGTPVLIDFGLVKRIAPEDGPSSVNAPAASTISIVDGRRLAVGTPGFSAPEQFTGGDITPATDIHALGALADACFGGHPPAAWRPIIRRATSSIPRERYARVSNFAKAVRRRRFRLAAPYATAALAFVIAGCAWAVSAVLHRPAAYLAPAVRALGNLAETRRDASGTYGYIKLNGGLRVIDTPVKLGRRRRLVIEGPGGLAMNLTGDRGSHVELRRCAFHNTTADRDPAHSPRYILRDGSLLNLMEFPVLDEALFAEPYDADTCAVIFHGQTASMRNLVPRLKR
jgi:serine/threonine protein kinase